MAVPGPLHDGYKRRSTEWGPSFDLTKLCSTLRFFFPLSFLTESATEAPNRTSDADVNVALPLGPSPHYEGALPFLCSIPGADKEKASIHLQDRYKTFKNMYIGYILI